MPRDTKCNHRNCSGGPCKSLTAEELEPTDLDVVAGKQLIADGWFQTSRRFRGIARIKPEFRGENLIKPEYLETAAGKAMVERWNRERKFLVSTEHHCPDFAEHRTLGVKEFAGFRRAGGGCW